MREKSNRLLVSKVSEEHVRKRDERNAYSLIKKDISSCSVISFTIKKDIQVYILIPRLLKLYETPYFRVILPP